MIRRTRLNLAVAAILATLLLLFISIIDASNNELHKNFSPEELQRVFHVNDYEQVPEYEVVHVRSIAKRDVREKSNGDVRQFHVTAFGEDFHLNLERNHHLVRRNKDGGSTSDNLRVLLAEVQDGKLKIEEVTKDANTSLNNAGVEEENGDLGEPYHDLANEAALTIRHDQNGALHMEGTIGKSLVIRPAPTSVRQTTTTASTTTVVDDEMFLDQDDIATTTRAPKKLPVLNFKRWKEPKTKTEFSNTNKGLHIVYRRKQDELLGGSDYLLMEPDRDPLIASASSLTEEWVDHAEEDHMRTKREAPTTIWPEVLVIADYDTYNMHGANSINIKRYFVSFWNGVDLRYKLLSGPRVRISLAGIIISKGRDATPYLENNRVKGDAVDSAAALTDMGKYLFRERRLPTYDLAVVVTKLDVCRRQSSGSCSKGTAGFAYVGGACVVNSRLEKVNSVAIVEDTGGFSGIIVAAHEVGHLLGAVHDGSPAPNYLGGPGAEHCRWEDGFIMSDLRHTERGFQWSACSITQFRHFLNSDTATCLHNVPHEDEELPRILPGKMLSLDAQCRKDRGTSACFKDDRVCAQLFCFDSKSGYCVSYRPAAEGSPCGDGQYCINGRCIFEHHDNYIPDFTKITETVVDKPVDHELGNKGLPLSAGLTLDSAATQARPVFVKSRQRTTTPRTDKKVTTDNWKNDVVTVGNDDNNNKFAAVVKTTTPETSGRRRTKFRYNTLIRKRTTTPSKSANDVTEATTSSSPSLNARKSDSICTDLRSTIAGGMSCKQFLRSFGDRYCSHPYILTNCCASRELICNNEGSDNISSSSL